MRRSPDPIDQLLALDPGSRGIAAFFCPGGARMAARSLSRGTRVSLVTGFVVRPGMAETDGPPGTALLGRALRRLGKSVSYVADRVTLPLLEAALKTLGEPAGLIVFPDREPAPLAAQRLLVSLAPTHLVAVETPGRGKDGDYRSARGQSIASWNTPLDELFIRRPSRVVSVGIGDGGNEIGMGNVRPRLLRLGPRARKIASVVTVDHLVVAGTANWGAYGVVAHLSILSGQNLLHTGEEERRLIAACVEAGGVDGLTRRPEPTVDGLPAEMHAAIVELLRSLVEGARSSDSSTGGQQS